MAACGEWRVYRVARKAGGSIMALSWTPLNASYVNLPPTLPSPSADAAPLVVSYMDLPPPNSGTGELVPEAIEWTLGVGTNVTWYYGNTAYDTVLEKWVEWHTWDAPDPEGAQCTEGSPENWESGSYAYHVISIEGL